MDDLDLVNSTDDSSGDDGTLTDNLDAGTRLIIYNFVLFSPFIVIPACIISARLFKYVIRLARAKFSNSDETEEDLIQDPLGELGLSVGRDAETLKEARRLRQEMRRLRALQREAIVTGELNESGEKEKLSDIKNQLASFGKQTQKTWNARFTPEAVRRFFGMTRWGRLWMMFQVLCTVISIINYIILTYRVVREEHRNIKRLDLFLAMVFLSDYTISLYMAEDRLKYYYHPMSLIDLLSILPPIVYYIVKDVSSSVWFLGLVRIFRATRILRTYRLVSFSQSEESRELVILGLTFVNFLFLSASIINALESLEIEHGPASLSSWHDSLYYIMVTFSTIGFGDLTPSSTISRAVVMVLIVVMIIFVPIQTSRLSEIYNSTSYYQRQKYVPNMRHAHVVVSGPGISFAAIVDFCREYFVADPLGHVVILCPQEPDIEVRRLLRHPNYRHRLVYLSGSSLSIGDLKRAGTDFATALFLLSGDNTVEAAKDESRLRCDAEVLMQTLTVKTAFPRVPVFAQVQETRTAELAVHCGCDRVLCLDEIEMALLARDCLVPGTLAMLQNLVHTYGAREHSQRSNDTWLKEYATGATNQLSSLKAPSGLIGIHFTEAAAMVYSEVGATLIGVLPAQSNEGINLNPGQSYCIKPDDVLVCIAEAESEVVLRIMLQFETRPTTNPFNLPQKTVRNLDNDMASSQLGKADVSNRWGSMHLVAPKSEDGTNGVRAPPDIDGDNTALPSALANHIILCGTVRARGLRHLVHCIRSAETDKSEVTPIVILVEDMPDTTQSLWADIINYRKVHLVQGTPLKRQSLITAGIETCRRIVIFQSSIGEGASDNAQSALADANSIFIVKLIQEEWPAAAFLVELSSGANTRYFSVELFKTSVNRQQTMLMLRDYSLGTRERLALYYRARAEAAKESDMMLRLWRFISGVRLTGPPLSPTGGSSTVDKQHQEVKRSYMRLNDETDASESNDSQEASFTMAQLARFEEEAELTESGLSAFPAYQFDAQFAAGRVATAALSHSLICQTYLRPYAIDVVAHLTASVDHMSVPATLAGKMYSELVLYFLYREIVVLGLLRGGAGWEVKRQLAHSSKVKEEPQVSIVGSSSRALNVPAAALSTKLAEDLTTKLPYVYTNCRGYEIVSAEDLVFVLPRSA
ncbi:hypothetical protein SmJEL517_g00214 [Synchytrium microbalum]|uniref:Ion transport domain-containing protein n=1 Tax=Synchytrium microbalum TaxID=1806994 RepID=A0A507CGB1_9FUNG|nr:uncharacterized protein SmJEL517_g00214 [Synchytrium microbalum]TPX38239.1 hypothetical protein SmJEL517_g00214 [Synchytrium microbalum]